MGFRFLGLKVKGLGFRTLGLRVRGSGLPTASQTDVRFKGILYIGMQRFEGLPKGSKYPKRKYLGIGY